MYETDITIQGTTIRIGGLNSPRLSNWGHIVLQNGPHAGDEHIEYNKVELVLDHTTKDKLLGLLMKARLHDQIHWKKQHIFDELNRIERMINPTRSFMEDVTRAWLKQPVDIFYIMEKAGSSNKEGFLDYLFPSQRTAQHRAAVDKWQKDNCETCAPNTTSPPGTFCPKIYTRKPSRKELKANKCDMKEEFLKKNQKKE